jgi:hypothetical protein
MLIWQRKLPSLIVFHDDGAVLMMFSLCSCHSVDDYLAQEKARLSRSNTSSNNNITDSHAAAPTGQSFKQDALTPPKANTASDALSTQSAEKSPLPLRLGDQKEETFSPRLLPLIRANSGNLAPTLSRHNSEAKGGFPNLRMGSKEDLSSPHGGARFPPILNRSGANSRNGSSSNLTQVYGPSGSNLYESTSERVRGDKSGGGGMEMDVDSPPKQGRCTCLPVCMSACQLSELVAASDD